MRNMKAGMKRTAKHLIKGESGFAALPMVLVLLILGAVIITPLLYLVITGQRAGTAHDQAARRLYAADTGIQDALWRVSAEGLPEWMVGDWNNDTYDHEPYEYALPELINGHNVYVQVQPIWLLEGLEDPAYGREPHGELVTVGNVTSAGHMEIVIVLDPDEVPGNYKLDRIGAWLPGGFEYISGSSNLETLPASDPAHCHPTVSDWQGGHTVIFDYGTAVDFEDFPRETDRRLVITLDYTPATGMTNAWSWCRTNRHDIYLSWSGDIKLFQFMATAEDPATGKTTTVAGRSVINETVGTYVAFEGDYAVTGNALLRDQDKDGRYRERLYKESPGVLSGIPASGTPKAILLYWTGWKSYPNNVFGKSTSELNALAANYRVTNVSLKVKVGSTTYDFGTVSATSWTVLPNGSSSSPNGWSYSCKADITDLVKDYFSDLGVTFTGNATYTVGHAEMGAAAPSDETMQGIWGSSVSDVFVVGDSGTIVHYDGSSWTVQPSGMTRGLKGAWGSASNNVFAVGERRYVLRYNGSAWSTIDSGSSSSPTLYGVWGSGANDVFVVGGSGTIRHWNGSTWNTSWNPTTQTLRGVWGTTGSNVWTVGERGSSTATIYRYNGSAWSSVTTGAPRVHLYGVWGSGSNYGGGDRVYAVGANGTILQYNGASWSAMTSGTSETLYGVWGTSASDVYAVGANGTILHFNGSAWSSMASGSVRNLYGVWGSGTNWAAGDMVYVVGESTGTASTILQYDGTAWEAVAGGYQLYSWVDGHSGETVVASTDYRLGDNEVNEWAYGSWSVLVLYTSPVTKARQMYLYDTFRYCNSYETLNFTIDGFLAPASIAGESEAARMTCFVGEGDAIYTGDNLYLNEVRLNNGASGSATAANNVWNSISNAMSYSPDGLDLDTFSVSYPTIQPADSSADFRITTGIDVWNVVYIMLSFRSDIRGSGILSYIII